MRRTGRALAAGAAVAGFTGALAFACVGGLWHKDTLDYAQIAREIAAGHGFSSRQAIYALHLRFLVDHGLLAQPWPNLHRFPMQSLIFVPAFALFGASTTTVLLTGMAVAAAIAALLFDWADMSLGRLPAIAVVGLFALNGAFFFELAAGVPEPTTCVFFLLAAYLLCGPGTAGGAAASPRRALLSGAALGLSVLARTNAITALPGLLLVALRGERGRAGRGALLCFGLLLAVAPWMVRNARLTGNPTFSLHSYYLLPAAVEGESKRNYSLDWVRDFVPPVQIAKRRAQGVWAKWRRNATVQVHSLPWLAGTFLVPLVACLALAPSLGGALQPLAWVTVLGFLANAVLCNLTDINPQRYSYFLVPPMMLLAIGVAWAAVRSLRRPAARAVALGAATLVLARPTALAATYEMVKEKSADPLPAADVAAIEAQTAPNAIVFSDASHLVTWLTGRRTIRDHFVVRPDGSRKLAVLDLEDAFGPIDGLYLTKVFQRRPPRRQELAGLQADPRFAATFRCLPKLASGALLCVRRTS